MSQESGELLLVNRAAEGAAEGFGGQLGSALWGGANIRASAGALSWIRAENSCRVLSPKADEILLRGLESARNAGSNRGVLGRYD